MKVEKLVEDKLKREYSVTIPAQDITKRIDAKISNISKKVSVPGFRKGKVPAEIVRKKYRDEVLGEVINEAVTSTSQETISNNKLKAATQPKIEITSYDEGKDLVYKLSVEVLPDVPEVDFSKIEITKTVADITDEDINKLLEEVTKNYKDFQPISGSRAAKLGDSVEIDFEGFVDGVAFQGGKAEKHKLELGSNSFIPGFEEQLVGVKKGDETTVTVKFPEQYHSKDLAGKNSEFKIKVHDILEAKESELNDEFAQKIGHKDMGALKEILKSSIEKDAEEMSRVLIKKELFDKLEKELKFDLPEKMVETELDSIIYQVKNAPDQHDHVHDENGHHPDHDKVQNDDELKKEYDHLAKRRVLLGILVTDIAQKEKIKVNQEEINRALMNEAYRFPGQEQQIVDFYRKNPNALNALSGPIIEEKVVDHILTKVKLKESKKPLEELRNLVLENNKE